MEKTPVKLKTKKIVAKMPEPLPSIRTKRGRPFGKQIVPNKAVVAAAVPPPVAVDLSKEQDLILKKEMNEALIAEHPITKRRRVCLADIKKEEKLEKRQKMMRLRMQGWTVREIAKELQMNAVVVYKEFQEIRAQNEERLAGFDRTHAISMCISVFENIEKECWENYRSLAPGSQGRNQFLNTIRAARNDQIKLLEDMGLLSKVALQINHNVNTQAVLKDMTEKTQQVLAMAFLRAQLKPLPEPEVDRNLPVMEAVGVKMSQSLPVPQGNLNEVFDLPEGDLPEPSIGDDEDIFGDFDNN
jgi:hypothetical protein